MIKVGLMGYGKAGQAVAQVLCNDQRFDLRWIARRTASGPAETLPGSAIPVIGLDQVPLGDWLDAHPVDAVIDFSNSDLAGCSKGFYTFDDMLMRKMRTQLAQA